MSGHARARCFWAADGFGPHATSPTTSPAASSAVVEFSMLIQAANHTSAMQNMSVNMSSH